MTDTLPPIYYLETVDQMRALADDLRLRILDAIRDEALTVTQLGARIGQPANKVHYHMRELEKVGLVRQVETREKGGILEKYFRAIANSYQVPATLLRAIPHEESVGALNSYLQIICQRFISAFAHTIEAPPPAEKLTLSASSLWLTDEEFEPLMERIQDLLRPYTARRGIAGERERAYVHIAHTVTQADTADPPIEPDNQAEGGPNSAGHALGATIRTPKASYNFCIGVQHYSRDELEQVAARNEILNINVLGRVSFATDIPAELVDRAVAHFKLRGTLQASPAVREVLARKK